MLRNGSDRVPPALKEVLKLDADLTKRFLIWSNNIVPVAKIRTYCKGLEISCHGIPWFAFWICFTWLFDKSALIPMQMNLLLGLFIDIVLIAVAKAFFRRRRPQSNKDDALGQIGPDVFSFPSGHASRAVFVALFFHYLYPLNIIFVIFITTWAVSVCISRILMNRHYILDVIGGCVVGLLNGCLMLIFWLEDDTAKWILSFLSDEKLDGGEYHV